MAYTGSIELISGITPKNGQGFPLVDAKDVYIDDTTRLDTAVNGLDDALNIIKARIGVTASHVFAGRENYDIDYPVKEGKPIYVMADVSNVGWIYAPNDTSNIMTLIDSYKKFVPAVNDTRIRYYSGNSYDGEINITIISEEEFNITHNAQNALAKYDSMILTQSKLSDITNGSKSINDFPLNTIITVGAANIGLIDYPSDTNGIGVYVTFDGRGGDSTNGVMQIFVTTDNICTRWKVGGDWTSWTNFNKTIQAYAQYNTRQAWLNDFPSDKLADIPVNRIVTIGAGGINPLDTPVQNFIGNVVTICSGTSIKPGAVQFATKLDNNTLLMRTYHYRDEASGGNYWDDWKVLADASDSNKTIQAYAQYNTRQTWLNDFPSDKLADIPVNRIVTIGAGGINPLDTPVQNFIGNVVTICSGTSIKPGAVQFATKLDNNTLLMRTYHYRDEASGGNYWDDWKVLADASDSNKTVQAYAQYNTRQAWLNDFPSDKLADIPVNRIVTIGASAVAPLDRPTVNFYGNVITICSGVSLKPGALQIAIKMTESCIMTRSFNYRAESSGGNYWSNWNTIDGHEEYYVGPSRNYTSFTSLLLDLKGNNRKKTIYIDAGEYDIFSEYLSEIANERIAIPDDNITASDYFEPYNAFIPNNTKIIGMGNVTLKMSPTVQQLESLSNDANKTGYGASRTWSTINVYGNVEIDNITVVGHNCRYCMHNDDHNQYPNSTQHYKNCRFIYKRGDSNSNSQVLGLNNTIGFGIQKNSHHIYENCEFYNETSANDPAFYGHDSESARNGVITLIDCLIHSSNYSDPNTIRLQTLAHSQGRIKTSFYNCYINGGIQLTGYYSDSPNNFEVVINNSNKVGVVKTKSGGGVLTDIYGVKWYNPLASPTEQNPLYIED